MGKMIKKKIAMILKELDFVLSKVDENQVNDLVDCLLKARRIVVLGAGRVGMASKAFAMRLSHMNFNAYVLGDSNVPKIGRKDLLLVCSGSGETQTIYDLLLIAKKHEAKIALITGNIDSRMAKLADVTVRIQAPSKIKQINNFKSIQPMTTLNEQSLWLFFDALVLILMKEKNYTEQMMKNNHSVLE